MNLTTLDAFRHRKLTRSGYLGRLPSSLDEQHYDEVLESRRGGTGWQVVLNS